MKLCAAKELIYAKGGYRVSFEKREGGMLKGDFFPDRDEEPIESVEEAWELARLFSKIDNSLYINIYVISAVDFTPIKGKPRFNTYGDR